MNRKDCKYFDECSAPLCPLDEDSLKNGIWYPDEEICRKRGCKKIKFVQNQTKISKRCEDVSKYFTYEMLNSLQVVRKGIVGLDPDKDEEKQLKEWRRNYLSRRRGK